MKYDYKNLKDLDYQPNQPQQPDQPSQTDRLNAILDNASSKIAGLKRYTKNQNKILIIFMLLKEIFTELKTDEEADDEQPDTADMFNLDCEKSDEQRRKGKFIKSIEKQEEEIDTELCFKYFWFQKPSYMLNSLCSAKGTKEYSNQIKNIEGRLNRLKGRHSKYALE